MSEEKSGQITIYSTPTCAFCHMAKEYFKSKNIDYTDMDVTTNPTAYNELMQKSGQLGVPVIDIAGSIIVGFDRNQIDAALRTQKLI